MKSWRENPESEENQKATRDDARYVAGLQLMSRIANKDPRHYHKCPVRGCRQIVRKQDIMCFDHWRMVPESIALAVYSTYRAAPRSEAHFAAMNAAVECVHLILEGTEPHQAAQHVSPRTKQSIQEDP